MVPKRFPMLAATLAFAGLLAACSVERFALRKFGDALAGSGSSFGRDDDPELVRAAAPFSLKLIEALLEQEPEHAGLLLAAASGFTQFAYAFPAQDAERLESEDLARSRAEAARARNLYRRARQYGLRGLELRHPGFERALAEDPRSAVADAEPQDVPLLYWTAASWGLGLSLSKDDPEELLALPSVEALIDRALELDPDWNQGAIHTFLITYEKSRIGAGKDWVERSRQHYERAVALGAGQLAAPYVAYAEAVPMQNQDKHGFEGLLGLALAVDLKQCPAARLENEIARARARWLLSRSDDLFLD